MWTDLIQKRSSLDDHWKHPINHPFAPKWVHLSLVRPTKAIFGWIPSNFTSLIIFSDDPCSLLVSFRQLFKFPLVVQCCNVICEWPLIEWPYNKNILHTEYICIKNVDVTEQTTSKSLNRMFYESLWWQHPKTHWMNEWTLFFMSS